MLGHMNKKSVWISTRRKAHGHLAQVISVFHYEGVKSVFDGVDK